MREEVLREAVYIDGRCVDLLFTELFRDEWEAWQWP